MKRTIRGIFFTYFSTIKTHLRLGFTFDHLEDYYLNPPEHTSYFINAKSANSKLVRALNDLT